MQFGILGGFWTLRDCSHFPEVTGTAPLPSGFLLMRLLYPPYTPGLEEDALFIPVVQVGW